MWQETILTGQFGERWRTLTPEQPVPDYYRVLEVVPTASVETIRAAYAAMAKRFHPDVNPDAGAVERMQRINEAYAVLSVPFQRRNYDLLRFKRGVVLPDTPDAPPRPDSPEPFPPAPVARPHELRPWRRISELYQWRRRIGRPRSRMALAATVAGATAAGAMVFAVFDIIGWLPTRTVRVPAASTQIASSRVHVIPPTAVDQAQSATATSRANPTVSAVATAGATTVPTPVTRPAAAVPVSATLGVTPATSATPPTSVPTESPPPMAGPAPGPPIRATDFVVAAAQTFPAVDRLVEASHRSPFADRAWAFQVNGCSVYAGEYDAADQLESARRYWAGASSRFVYQSGGGVVVGVGDCDSPLHQYQVLQSVQDVFGRAQ
jgi:hypothetical protein